MTQRQGSVPRWLWWLFGCGLAVGVFLLCSCGIGGFLAYRFFRQQAAPPLTRADLRRLVPDLPIYPNATFDEAMTNFPSYRLLSQMHGDESGAHFHLVVFLRTRDRFQKVANWYRRALQRSGWREEPLTAQMPKWARHVTSALTASAMFHHGGVYLFLQRQLGYNGVIVHCVIRGVPDWEMERLQKRANERPEDGAAWATLSYGHFCLGRWESAKQAAQKALRNPPSTVPSQSQLALTLLWLEDYRNALPLTEKLAQKTHRWQWSVYQAYCLSKTKKFTESERVLTAVLPSVPNRYLDRVYLLRGSVRLQLKRVADGLSDYEQAYRRNRLWWRVLAWHYWRAGKRERAWQIVKEAAKFDPFAQNLLVRREKAVWLSIYDAQTPSWMTGRWVKATGIKGEWAVAVAEESQSRNFPALKGALVYAVNGAPFVNEKAFMQRLDKLSITARSGDVIVLSVWLKGKKEEVPVRFEPFFPLR